MVDVAEDDGGLLHHPESVSLVYLHQESGVDVGVSVLTPGTNVIKLFTAVIYECSQ